MQDLFREYANNLTEYASFWSYWEGPTSYYNTWLRHTCDIAQEMSSEQHNGRSMTAFSHDAEHYYICPGFHSYCMGNSTFSIELSVTPSHIGKKSGLSMISQINTVGDVISLLQILEKLLGPFCTCKMFLTVFPLHPLLNVEKIKVPNLYSPSETTLTWARRFVADNLI